MARANSDLKVTVFWGDILYDTAVCKPNESVTIGRSPDNTFILELDRRKLASADSFKLVDVFSKQRASLHFNDSIDGHIRIGGKELYSLQSAIDTHHVTRNQDGSYEVALSSLDRADVSVGHMSFYFDWVRESIKLPHSPVLGFKKFLLGSIHIVFISE